MAMRLSGLMSGMDTESVIQQLVMAKRTKVDTTKKAQTKLQWKSDIWKTLNSKIKKLYDGALSNLRFEGSYMKKVTKVSNSSVASVITGAGAMNSVQTLEVTSLAQSGYLTGGQLNGGDKDYTTSTKLTALGMDLTEHVKIKVSVGGEEKEIDISGASTIGDVVSAFQKVGLNASFDAANQRFFLASKDTGEKNDFNIFAGDAAGLDALQKLGLNYLNDDIKAGYQEIIDSRDQFLADTLDNSLKTLSAERVRLQGLLDERRERLKAYEDDFVDEEGNKLDLDSDDPEVLAAIKKKAKELYEADSEKYANLYDWGGSWNNLTGRLKNINAQLDIDEDGNVQGLSESLKESITAEVDAKIQPYKDVVDGTVASGAVKSDGLDARVRLNGVDYKFDRNTFEVNGLTITVNSTTADGEKVTLTTQDDTDGIYDMIKNFFKEYNELINEMDKLYNADSAKGYEPLTDEEKEAMSEKEIEEWETKVKDSLLRRDDTLGTVSMAIKQMMLSGITVNGKTMYLSNFGIETLSYFAAAENEKNAFHINGDPDDPNTSGNADDLKSMIANDPQTVVDFFVGLSRNMYAELTTRMAKTEYSSSYTIYEDVRMKQEYDEYTEKIKQLEKKLSDYEDNWYQKFAKMETALAKLQSGASAVTSLLGG
ncbi:MAG: flagellar filament capping protein FliD [Acetatifactor sp.]|nr:flagellar filament capping protein FliD [Acetatifactor sp.]